MIVMFVNSVRSVTDCHFNSLPGHRKSSYVAV